jgi:acyl-CoA reductase-like NAD-dependent aldehyde dehydrogenase
VQAENVVLTPAGRVRPPILPPSRLYIDGTWRETEDGEDVPNPATEEVVGRAPVGSVTDAADALRAARRAFDSGPWPRLSPRERGARLGAFHQALARRTETWCRWWSPRRARRWRPP